MGKRRRDPADSAYVEEFLRRTHVHGPAEPADLFEPDDEFDVYGPDGDHFQRWEHTVTREQYQERAA